MAKKEEATNMVERFAEFKELKHIDKTTMISVLEESFRNVLAKMFGTDQNLDVIMNPDKGDVQIFQNLEVVPDGEVTNPYTQISLSDARADQNPDVEVGEEHTREIIFEKFGRRAAIQRTRGRTRIRRGLPDLEQGDPASRFRRQRNDSPQKRVYSGRLFP